MRRLTAPVLLALLIGGAGCDGDKGDATVPDTDSGTPAPPCDVVSVDAFWPGEALNPTSRAAALTLSFSGVASEEGVSVQLLDAAGAEVAGALSLSEGQAVFSPAELLAADTSFTWSATICDATASGSFTTGAHGPAVAGDPMVDSAFAIDLAEATWIEPRGGDDLFSSLFGGVMLLGVEAADAATLDLIVAVGQVYDIDGDEIVQQDPCYATADFEPADFRNNPYAEVGPTALNLEVSGVPVTLQGVRLAGAFTEDGTSLVDGTLTAEADARDVSESVGYSGDELCDLLKSFLRISCTACATDGEPYCVGLSLEDVTGVVQPGIRVVPNTNPSECD